MPERRRIGNAVARPAGRPAGLIDIEPTRVKIANYLNSMQRNEHGPLFGR